MPALLDSLASLASVSALPLGAWLRDDTTFLGGGDAARALCAAAEAVATEAAEAAAEAGGPLRSSELLRRPRIAALGLLREPCAWAGCGGGRDAAPPACFRCSRCKGVLYCSAVCQRADWPSHRNHCTPVAAVSGSDAAAAGISRLSVAGGSGRRAELAAASGGGGDGGDDEDEDEDEEEVPIRRVADTQESEDDGGEDDEVDVPIRRVGAGGGADTETLEQSWERMQASVASGRAQRLDVQYEVLQR